MLYTYPASTDRPGKGPAIQTAHREEVGAVADGHWVKCVDLVMQFSSSP